MPPHPISSLPRRTSIRVQILVAMLLIGGLTLVIVTLQSLHCAHEGLMDVQGQTFRLLLAQQRSQIDRWLTERAGTMQLVADSPIVQAHLAEPSPANVSALREYLDDVRRDSPYFEVLAAYRPDGRPVVIGETTDHQAPSLLEPRMLDRVQRGASIVWSDTPHIHGPDYMALHAAVPVRDETGALQGIVAASLMLDEAARILDEPSTADSTMVTYLVDLETGVYLSVPPSMAERLGQSAISPVAALKDEPAHLLAYESVAGTPVIGMATPLPRFGWLLVVEMEQAEAFAMLRFLLHRAGISGLVVAALIVLLALLSARRLAKPLQSVTATCQRVASGALQQRLPPQPSREAHDLSEAFNTMLDRLDTTRGQLVQAGALAAVGELSASVVHEMRNPLNTIQMNLQAMRRKIADDEKLTELHELAQRQAGRLQEMLSHLLQFSKPLELDVHQQDLCPIVEEALAICEPRATKCAVAFKPHLPATPVTAAVDAEQLCRVLTNLIENAILAQEAGGEVAVDVHADVMEAVIQVADHGPGIPTGMQDKIFRPFFTTRPAGTGLGLAMVKKILDLHRATIEVTSREDRGTTFTIRLPTDPGASA